MYSKLNLALKLKCTTKEGTAKYFKKERFYKIILGVNFRDDRFCSFK